jgi:hypothetical protein
MAAPVSEIMYGSLYAAATITYPWNLALYKLTYIGDTLVSVTSMLWPFFSLNSTYFSATFIFQRFKIS